MIFFDSWYSSTYNLKTIRKFGWHWIIGLKKNRSVNPDNNESVQIQSIDILPEGRVVHLKAYGFIKIFRIVSKDEDTEYWAADSLSMNEIEREELGQRSWKI